MVGGTDPELEEIIEVKLPDGDRVEVLGPIEDTQAGYTLHLYRNKDTRALDEKFGLNGEPIPEDFVKSIDSIYLTIGQADLGNVQVSSTLAYFVNAAYVAGWFAGMREEDIRKLNPSYFHPDLALEHTNGNQESYLVKKRVDITRMIKGEEKTEAHYVLFPRGLPLESMALPEQAVA